MPTNTIRDDLTTRPAQILIALILVSSVYSVLVMANIELTIDILRLVVILFVLYLFYRLVLAVELIADKL